MRSLEFNYRSTPFYEHYEGDLKRLVNLEGSLLGEYSGAGLRGISDLLELPAELVYASKLTKGAHTVSHVLDCFADPQLVVLEDTAEVDAAAAGTVEVLMFEEPVYRQNFSGFEPGMSSIDSLFNLGPHATRELLVCASR